MTDKLRAYLDGLFVAVPDTREVREAKDELYDGMVERYEDCLREGMDEQAAYDCVVDSIGDIRELIDELDLGDGAAGGEEAGAGQAADEQQGEGRTRFSLDDLVRGVAGFAERMVSGVTDWLSDPLDPVLGEMRLVNTLSLPLDGVDSIDIHYVSDALRLRVGGGDKLVVNEYMNRDDAALYGEARSTGGTVEVRHGRRSGLFILRSRIEVTLPAGWYGSLSVSTVSGRIHADDSLRLVSLAAKSVSGEIALQGVAAGVVRLSTTSGAIRLQDAEGELDLHTVSGSIRVQDITGGGSFGTTSGGVRLGFAQLAGNVKVHTVSGGIRLSIPEDAGVELDLKSTSGSIHTAFNDSLSYQRRNRVHAFVGSEPYHYVLASSTSGGIHIND